MQKLAEICIRRPVFALMLIAALMVVGVAGYLNLGVDRFPAVDLPTVSVRVTLPGASPEEVESEVTKLIEEVLNTIEGIDTMRSVSGAGVSNVSVTFDLKRNIDVAAQDVRDRIAVVKRRLPDDAEEPVVSKQDNDAQPVLTLALSGPRGRRELTELADKVVKVQLERSRGVGEVRVNGGLARAMNLWLYADMLAAYRLSVTDVRDAVARQNADVPAGNVTGAVQEATLRTMGKLSDEQSFNELVIRTVNGAPVRIADVGFAEDGTAEQRSVSRLDGQETVTLEVRRQSGANTVEVIEAVKANLARVAEQLPADIRIEIIRDQSRYIHAALHEINVHLLVGSVLACLVVLLFVRSWRTMLIAGVAIPASLVATFGMMWLLDFTLNGVTMLALVLMVGIVIDDAIVVLENIYRFVEEKGMGPFEAARAATAEIGLAVMATTFSLVVIFVPVSFMSSVSGRFLYQFGITAAVAVLVSLLVSFTLTPMMSARLLRRGGTPGGQQHDQASSRRGFYRWIDAGYTGLLRLALRFRLVVALVALGVIASAVPLYQAVQQEYVPSDVDEAEFFISVSGPEGLSLAAMNQAVQRLEQDVREVPGVRTVQATVGSGFLGSVNQANFYVRIAGHEERRFSVGRLLRATLAGRPGQAFQGNYTQREVMQQVRRKLRAYPDLRCSVRNFSSFNIGGGNFDIDMVVRGPELQKLLDYSEELRARAQARGGFTDLDTSLKLDKPEFRVWLDRPRAADRGVQARDAGIALRLLVGGDTEVTRFRDEALAEDYDVRLRLVEGDRSDPALLEDLYLPGRGGELVQMGDIARVSRTESPSRIDRFDRQRAVSMRGGVAPGFAQARQLEILRQTFDEMDVPPGYSVTVSGRGRELERTGTEFIWAFMLSVILMYMILAAQFESLLHPLTILLSLPLAVPFALIALWGTGDTLNLFSALGVLVLFGVVKKNAILQIDHMNQLRAAGMNRYDAIITGNRDRLRPILMTTLCLIAGMMPLLLGTGPGAEERRTIAVVVVGGQAMALLLTLIVTPVAYSLFDDLGAFLKRVLLRRRVAAAAAPTAAP